MLGCLLGTVCSEKNSFVALLQMKGLYLHIFPSVVSKDVER